MIAKLSTVYLALSYGISGSNLIYREVFILVYTMYKTAKACASSDGRISDTRPCLVGVRQGENLSPLLAPAVTVGETEGAMDSTSVLFFTSSFVYNFARK